MLHVNQHVLKEPETYTASGRRVASLTTAVNHGMRFKLWQMQNKSHKKNNSRIIYYLTGEKWLEQDVKVQKNEVAKV